MMIAAALAGAAYFIVVFAAGTILGAIRMLLVAPAIGKLAAVALELPILLGWSWIVAGWLLRRRVPPSRAFRLVMGGTGFALLLAAELSLTLLLPGSSVVAFLARYREPAEQLGLAGQIGFALLPLVR